MGGTKPKTGGLAALLRIVKERLAREASGGESSLPPHSEGTQTEASERAQAKSVNPGIYPTDKKDNILSVDSEEVASVPLPGQMVGGSLEAAQGNDDTMPVESFAPVEVEPARTVPISKTSETTKSSNLPIEQRIRQATQNAGRGIGGAGSNRFVVKKSRAKALYGKQYKFISTNLPPELQTFVDRWKPFLTETQLNVCIYVYNNSAGLGLEYCFTSTPKLMSVVSKTERQVKTVLGQLIT